MSVLNRRLRVLHGPTNVGNQPYVLSRNERRLGVASQLVVNYDTWLKYPADRVLSDLGNRSRRNVARRGWFAATAPFRADVFHMYFGRSFSCWDDWGEPNRWWFREIALAKRLGRVTVMTLQGCDVRQSDISSERNAVTMCHVGHCAAAEVCRSTLDDRRRAFARDHLPMFDRVLVLNPELAHFVPRADFFPYGNVEIREFTPTPPAVEGPVRIVHAPSDEAIKGSKYIYEAIDALREQFDIEFTVVKGLPHAEAIRLYAQADLVIDQVLAGWYGGFAVEAMAMGKPVAAFVRETDLRRRPSGDARRTADRTCERRDARGRHRRCDCRSSRAPRPRHGVSPLCRAVARPGSARSRVDRCLPRPDVADRPRSGGLTMCGITGVVGAAAARADLDAMAAALTHRGPDDSGTYGTDGAVLGFRRLAIVDLVGGHQPMTNEDGSVHVVYNGEIYDHRPLRRHLEQRGHRFASHHSDTEVLVHGWEEWGSDLFRRLNGMFGLAIWSDRDRTLVLARDRYGIKPVYYATLADGSLVFGSEIRSIIASGLISGAPSALGVREYLAFQNVWGDRTMFEDVRLLEPGCSLIWRDGKVVASRYWDIEFPRSRRGSTADLAHEHRSILESAMSRQMQADVPVMSYLSGGIDSTAVTVAARRAVPDVKAYSCIFDLTTVGDDRFVDEREFSSLVASELGIERVVLELSPTSLERCLDRYVWALEDLRMGMGYPIDLIAERVAADAKVVMSGTGGDEFHGGYVGRYQVLGLTGAQPATPTKWWQRRRQPDPVPTGAVHDPWPTYQSMLNFIVPHGREADMLQPAFAAATAEFDASRIMGDMLKACPSDDWFDRVMYLDAKTYLHGLLVIEDKLSMSHGLETRVPLLDNELIDFVLDLPTHHLCQGDTGKIIFRESVRPWVPKEIYTKPKMGFGPPDASWYRTALRPWIEQRLSTDRVEQGGIFQPAFAADVLDAHMSGASNNAYLIWTMLLLDSWLTQFGGVVT